MARQIALLRGINVGGHRKVPMARLRELMDELGYEDVATYVQSGNVVFTGPDRPAADVERDLEKQLEATFGFDVSVVVRTRDELAAVVAANPLGDVADEPKHHFVLFLGTAIDPSSAVEGVDAAALAPEAFHVGPREVHLWCPDGVRNSRVLKTFSEKRLGAVATSRNWRTVEQLLELADGAS
jgi:uncharacterized protein (DUF1697 family)